MVVLFTAINNQTGPRSFSFRPTDLESGLDFLNIVQARGDSILSAHLIDEDGIIELPIETIDGIPFAAPIHKLEQEWKAVLAKCIPPVSCIDQELVDWNLKRIDNCEEKLANQVLMVERLNLLLQRAEEKLVSEPERSQLVDHYKLQIDTYNQQIANSQARHERISRRLHDLLAL